MSLGVWKTLGVWGMTDPPEQGNIMIPKEHRKSLNSVAGYLRTQGFSGGTNDVILQWLISEGYGGQINDALCDYWSSLNLEGSYNDKESKWKRI